MATSRKSASHRTKAAKSRSGPKPAKRPAAAARRPDAKPMKKPTAKPVAASGKIKGKPVLVAKSAGGKGAARGVTLNPGALKAAALAAARKAALLKPGAPKFVKGRGPLRPGEKAARPTPPVRPIGVLPPEAIARGAQKPARPVAIVARPGAVVPHPVASPAELRGVTQKDYPAFEKLLLAERQRVLKEMGHLENTVLKINQRDSAGDLSGYSFHMADVGTDAMEREKAFLFASAEGRILMEINEALRRIHRGEYGVCEICGSAISRPRLEALLYARLCLSCKEKEEKAARGAQ